MRIALALGSGGARGYAHIGVLAALADRDHEVVAIAGTSMGALVGGLYAAGRLDEYTEWVTGLSQRDVLLLLDPALTSPGIIRAERIIERVADILDGVRIEELAIPFTAVATDLTSQREVWFQHGPVSAAIRASIAIPSAITPVMLHGHLLVDGGLLNPVPVDVLGGATADVTVGVDLNGQASSGLGGPPVTESADENPSNGWLEVIRRTAGRIGRRVDTERRELGFEELPGGLRTVDILSASLNATEALITRFRTAANPPDVWVRVPVDAATTWDFHRAGELIDLGRTLTAAALDEASL